jgi:hypothetical protein
LPVNFRALAWRVFWFFIPWIVMQLLTGLLIKPLPRAVLIAILPEDRSHLHRTNVAAQDWIIRLQPG